MRRTGPYGFERAPGQGVRGDRPAGCGTRGRSVGPGTGAGTGTGRRRCVGRRCHQRLAVGRRVGAVDADREGGRDPHAGAVHRLDVQVRFARVARVAALGDLLAGHDPVAPSDAQRPPAEVGERHVGAVVALDDHMVAEDARRSDQLAHALDHQVGEAGRRRAGPVVAPAVAPPDDRPGDRRPHRSAEAGEVTGPAGERRPRHARARPVVGVAHEVDGVGLGPPVQHVAGDPGGRAVQCDPPSGHRAGEVDDRPGGRAEAQVESQGQHEHDKDDAGHDGRRAEHQPGGEGDECHGQQRHPNAGDQTPGRRRAGHRLGHVGALPAVAAAKHAASLPGDTAAAARRRARRRRPLT